MGELHFCLLCPPCTALDQASSLSRLLAYVSGPTFGFVKLLASAGSHCTKWADEQHRQAGFESRLVPDLPLPFIPTLIGLRAFDLVSSRVWWEAATNTWFGRNGEGRSNPRQCGTNKWLPPFCQTTIWPSVRIRGPELKAPAERFSHSLHQEIKVKINESRLRKFYQENSTKRKSNWKKIQLRILPKTILKKTRNLMNSKTFR